MDHETDLEGLDMTGFEVVARDGDIGKIDPMSDDAGSSYVVLDTGFSIMGQKSLIPAAAIEAVDADDGRR